MVHFGRCMFKNSALRGTSRRIVFQTASLQRLMSGFKLWCDSHRILRRTGVRPRCLPTKDDVLGQILETTLVTRVRLLLGMSIASPAAAATFDAAWNVQIASLNSACGGATVSIGINN